MSTTKEPWVISMTLQDVYKLNVEAKYSFDGAAPPTDVWNEFLSKYLRIITGSSDTDTVSEKYHANFVAYVELLTLRRFHRLLPQRKQFQMALKEYKKLSQDPPATIVIYLYKLSLFGGIYKQFLEDLRALRLAVIEEVAPVFSALNENISFTKYLLASLTRYNRFAPANGTFLFNPFFAVSAILSIGMMMTNSTISVAIGPELIRELLTVVPHSVLSEIVCASATTTTSSTKRSISAKLDVAAARDKLQKALKRAEELGIEDHETFLCSCCQVPSNLMELVTLTINYIGFSFETCRTINTYTLHPSVNGKEFDNANDCRVLSLSKMLVRDARASPLIFCWTAHLAEMAINSSPTVQIASINMDVARLRTIPMSLYVVTNSVSYTRSCCLLSFTGVRRTNLTAKEIHDEFVAEDHTRVFRDGLLYRAYICNSLPYGMLPKYAIAFCMAYLYLRCTNGFRINQFSLDDVEDLYIVARYPTEFFTSLKKTRYTPIKFLRMVIKYQPTEMNYTKMNGMLFSFISHFLRESTVCYNIPEEYYNCAVSDANEHGEAIPNISQYINLKNPLTHGRIVVPIRSNNCQHLKCVDLWDTLSLACETGNWQCPICAERMSLSNLYIDLYQYALINYLTATDSKVNKVAIDPVNQMPVLPDEQCGGDRGENEVLSDWVDDVATDED